MSRITVKRRPGFQQAEGIEWSVDGGEVYKVTFRDVADCVGKALFLERDGGEAVRIPVNDTLELLDSLKWFILQEGTA